MLSTRKIHMQRKTKSNRNKKESIIPAGLVQLPEYGVYISLSIIKTDDLGINFFINSVISQ